MALTLPARVCIPTLAFVREEATKLSTHFILCLRTTMGRHLPLPPTFVLLLILINDSLFHGVLCPPLLRSALSTSQLLSYQSTTHTSSIAFDLHKSHSEACMYLLTTNLLLESSCENRTFIFLLFTSTPFSCTLVENSTIVSEMRIIIKESESSFVL